MKRYVGTIEMYVWAENDDQAIDNLSELCKEQRRLNNNDCSVVGLVEQPTGTLGNRVVIKNKQI